MTQGTEPAMEEARRAFREVAQAAASFARAAQALGRHAPEMAEEAKKAYSEAKAFAEGVRETAGSGLSGLRGRTADVREAAADELETAQGLVLENLRERPAVIAAAALGVGFILGVVLMGRRS